MSIRSLGETTAVARLSALRFNSSLPDVAAALAEWEHARSGLLVPIPLSFPRRQETGDGESDPAASVFIDRARQTREKIADALGLDATAASRLTFTMTSKEAWYLGPRPNLTLAAMLAAVRSSPEKYIELMLQKEFMEEAAFAPDHVFVTGGFGPGVYLSSLNQNSRNRVHLAEVKFSVNGKHGLLLCDVTAKVFARKTKIRSAEVSKSTLAIDVGKGFMLDVSRIVPSDFFELDARQYPMTGVSLDTTKIRQSRLYFLNVVTEFATRLFQKAGIPIRADTFVATHCVDHGYIPLEPIAQLKRPLVVINATEKPLTDEVSKPLQQLRDFMGSGYHVAGNKKVHFEAMDVHVACEIPEILDPGINYLFLNGNGDDDHGSVRIAKRSTPTQVRSVRSRDAYAALAGGDSVADAYTEHKYRHLLDRPTVSVAMQGLDYGPEHLASLMLGKDADRQLQEALKRCFVELSLKECLLGEKTLPTPAMPADLAPTSLTLLATRQIRMPGKQPRKQLVSAVDVEITNDGIAVSKVRRSPWSSDAVAAIDFVFEFDFLQPNPKEPIRNGQLWIIDRLTQQRMTVWSGGFVPKIILNDQYAGIEAALAIQENHLQSQRMKTRKNGTRGQGKFYSKSRDFNLLPYYMSMFKKEHQAQGERNGTRIPFEDRGAFVRVFVPPEGGISGKGDALSGLRDVMLYHADGTLISKDLLHNRLVQIYLHSMTNGILVGGDNSKMSILEKLSRLALEN